MPYTEEDRLTTENNLLNLLQCLENNGLKIDNESRNLCARELSDRHDYAIFYQKLGQYADIVIDKFDHYQIRPNILTCQLDIDALVAIIHNKGKITIAPTENLPIENIISLYQGQSWFKTCNIEAIKDHADMKEHNIIKKTIEHTIFVFVGHHNLKYEFANLLAKQLSKRLHSYVIFETYDSMTCSSHIEIRNSRIDLEDFQRKLQTTPDEQIFAITHDKGLIHILDSENDYIPQLVEIRYNSLYRRSSDDPSLRLHSYVHLVSPSLNPPSKDSAAGRKSNIQNSSHAASTVNPNVYPHPQAFSHATYAADDTYETYDPHANVPYPYPYSYPQGYTSHIPNSAVAASMATSIVYPQGQYVQYNPYVQYPHPQANYMIPPPYMQAADPNDMSQVNYMIPPPYMQAADPNNMHYTLNPHSLSGHPPHGY